LVPRHPGGKRNNLSIVATFHTHPNPGPEFQQEPSLTDIRAVRDDPDLSPPDYEGEYVIASEWIYRIHKNGRVESVGETKAVLKTN
jgi:proteasome lid subunit RPN8/RPN11